jgi:hypothetical protein
MSDPEPFVFGTARFGSPGHGGPFEDDDGWPQSPLSCLLGTLAFAGVVVLIALVLWLVAR